MAKTLLLINLFSTILNLSASRAQLSTIFLSLAFLLNKFLYCIALIGQVDAIPSGCRGWPVMMSQHIIRFEWFEDFIALLAGGWFIGCWGVGCDRAEAGLAYILRVLMLILIKTHRGLLKLAQQWTQVLHAFVAYWHLELFLVLRSALHFLFWGWIQFL